MQPKINRCACLCIVSLVLILYYSTAVNITENALAAAKPSLSISFYKNNGYEWGNDINGLFTLNTEVSADVKYVEFYLDDQLQLNDTTAPFSWPFDTNDYTLGLHTIKVTAYDASGEQTTVEEQRNFVEFPLLFVVGIIIFVVVTVVVSIVIVLIKARREEAEEKREKAHRHT
jgi:hypothetical protein